MVYRPHCASDAIAEGECGGTVVATQGGRGEPFV